MKFGILLISMLVLLNSAYSQDEIIGDYGVDVVDGGYVGDVGFVGDIGLYDYFSEYGLFYSYDSYCGYGLCPYTPYITYDIYDFYDCNYYIIDGINDACCYDFFYFRSTCSAFYRKKDKEGLKNFRKSLNDKIAKRSSSESKKVAKKDNVSLEDQLKSLKKDILKNENGSLDEYRKEGKAFTEKAIQFQIIRNKIIELEEFVNKKAK